MNDMTATTRSPELAPPLSDDTLLLAHEALLVMRQGVEPWAQLKDRDVADRLIARLDAAIREIRRARGV